MELKYMLQPFKIGSVEIPNRFAVTAMVTNMCDSDGYATEQYIRYHEAKAKGGYGLIITEDYAVNAHAGGYARVARIYKEDMIPGHRKVTETVHKHGARIFCQVYHAGRQSNSDVNGGAPTKSATAQACPWNRQMADALTTVCAFCMRSMTGFVEMSEMIFLSWYDSQRRSIPMMAVHSRKAG